jgi:hypothetical protein
LEAVLPLLNPLGHCCHIIAISIIRLTLHLVSANSSHTALSPYLPPLPSQPAFVPYPFCLKFDFQCKAVWDMLTSCCLSRIPIAFPRSPACGGKPSWWAMPGFELEGLDGRLPTYSCAGLVLKSNKEDQRRLLGIHDCENQISDVWLYRRGCSVH